MRSESPGAALGKVEAKVGAVTSRLHSAAKLLSSSGTAGRYRHLKWHSELGQSGAADRTGLIPTHAD